MYDMCVCIIIYNNLLYNTYDYNYIEVYIVVQ